MASAVPHFPTIPPYVIPTKICFPSSSLYAGPPVKCTVFSFWMLTAVFTKFYKHTCTVYKFKPCDLRSYHCTIVASFCSRIFVCNGDTLHKPQYFWKYRPIDLNIWSPWVFWKFTICLCPFMSWCRRDSSLQPFALCTCPCPRTPVFLYLSLTFLYFSRNLKKSNPHVTETAAKWKPNSTQMYCSKLEPKIYKTGLPVAYVQEQVRIQLIVLGNN